MRLVTARGLLAYALYTGLAHNVVAQAGEPQTVESRSAREVVVPGPDQNVDDDGPALQRAIDSVAGAGGVVRIGPGVYRLKIRDGIRALVPKRNVRIVGDGRAQTILRLGSGQPAYNGVFYPEHKVTTSAVLLCRT